MIEDSCVLRCALSFQGPARVFNAFCTFRATANAARHHRNVLRRQTRPHRSPVFLS